ncbi:MAG TPA: dienelactone hydrolase family protein [Polyangiales bacterium]|nr:dienelactone hydrolase family protein [Polyangiales bacterium]
MSRWRLVALLIAALAVAGLALSLALRGEQVAADDKFAPPDARGWGRVAEFDYLESVRSGARPDERLPMVVLIHGLGDEPRADWLDLVPQDVRARVIMPRGPMPYHRGYSWFPFEIGEHRSASLAKTLGPRAQQLSAALQQLQARRPTRGLPIVCGFSQGGMLSFAMATRYPERFALALPISGGLPDALWPTRAPAGAARLPIRAVHGARDTIVPIEPTRELTARLRELGYDASLRELPELGHAISPEVRQQVISELSAAIRGR